jgi:hypothetical protein
MKLNLDAALAMAIALCCHPSCETPSTASLLAMVGSSSCGNGGSNNNTDGGDYVDGNGSNDDVNIGGGGPFRSNSIVHQACRRAPGGGRTCTHPTSARMAP